MTNAMNPMNPMTKAARQCRLAAGLLALSGAAFLTAPAATADQPATCQSRHVDGVEEDVCVGIPGQAGGANPRDLYPGVVPELYFGVGIG
ncbi:hypothetical protein [Mycolicibacterium mucogenicum]|uniref:Keratin associated protein n=1 Tax=Mycolicibacterium mucogenicum DSM 44124 TaxID=1226753 RepID=A0A8H2JCS2_MYCMU|nr:hypothetical protein [Mycolicibacterium mucogenicum]KAB7754888.1 hypothetical protein MMUC44124_21330 [Mycolicibacterium mucogenicum DSM 44124]QPG71031.1 hypothetical protein C1S78_008860 [Mycolicibacterium mucogenicum DSM 44124]